MLLRGLLNLLEMLIVAVFSEPRNNISIRPIDLKRMAMLVINMVLQQRQLLIILKQGGTYVDWDLVDMNPFLNTKLRHYDIECGIQYANDFCLADNRAVTLGQVGNEQAEVKVCRLLLSKPCHILFAVSKYCQHYP